MFLDKIFTHNEEWIKSKLVVDKNYFKELAKGQSPEILYIGCSDSRVATEELLGADPGEVFVHRNIANMVISIDLNVMSVITYAVEHLKVKHIVICGHYYCGGVKAAMEAKDLGLLNPWLRNIRDVYRIHKDELDNIEDTVVKYNRLTELNVEEQCINLIKTAAVQKAFIERGLSVHGWIFDIRSGKLIDLKINFKKKLKEIMEIYNLNEGKDII
ncbi:carbonic anhydrase [Apibacter muscae]|uniref:Carbonic anhydrase 2 n=1 Tax=Apibacter muscae TaxID=2509004 RepID=A0A563DJZ5_9FLAO|nr:carbonic anhydrase [Apibacter muscae]TWP25237.1 carbonic anhydrase [Apibacter muscae]TWP30556.1 carbonic anhydrase [Apibacter muscae]TWP31392.1 carbonic anhydrase [Apibacter muscae]